MSEKKMLEVSNAMKIIRFVKISFCNEYLSEFVAGTKLNKLQILEACTFL